MRKRTKILIATVILLAIAVCVLPWPTFFKVQVSGYMYLRYSKETIPVEVTVQGTTFHYLFFRDQTRINFVTSGVEDLEFSQYKTPAFPLEDVIDVPYIVGSNTVFDTTNEREYSAIWSFSMEEEMLLMYIRNPKEAVVACSAGQLSREEIETYFDTFVQRYGGNVQDKYLG